MKTNGWALLAAVGLLLAQPPAVAITEVLSSADISRALAIASGPEGARSRFHAPYIVASKGPYLEHIEVVTEFRRFVLAAEEQAKRGNWMVARGGYDVKGRTLKDILRPFAGQVAITARVRFHPLNAYVQLPTIDILLGEPSLLAIDTVRTPSQSWASGKDAQAMVGAVIEATFNAPSVNDRVLPVRVVLEGQDLGGPTVDFSRLE